MIQLSVIIPTYYETGIIDQQIEMIYDHAACPEFLEIIICDVESSTQVKDNRVKYFNCAKRGRSAQMNCGAAHAIGEVYYFLHADSLPPRNFDRIILNEIEKGNEAGCFRLKFDHDHFVLNISSWFSRFNMSWCRGGDQSLFISRSLFKKLKGFKDSFQIMEDIEMVQRIKKSTQFKVLEQSVITSARKYLKNGIYRLQFLFGLLHLKYRLGYSQKSMVDFYQRFILT